MGKKSAFAATLAIGAVLTAGSASGHAATGSPAQGGPVSAPAAPAPAFAGNVQLNADTAAVHGLKGNYQGDGSDIALGGCVAPGTDGTTAPHTARFSSPVLTFGDYDFGPFVGVPANVLAHATLKPGTPPGTYPLVLDCDGKSYRTTFSVSRAAAPQVVKLPSGAPYTGGGAMADQVSVARADPAGVTSS